MPDAWYSACLRFVVLVEGHGAQHYNDQVRLVRAASFEDAFRRAVEVGTSAEQTYLNGDRERVRWALKEILTLDVLSSRLADGAEVFSWMPEIEAKDRTLLWDATFDPAHSNPSQTGVVAD